MELAPKDSGSEADRRWRLTIFQVLAVVYSPFVVAVLTTYLTADTNAMTNVFWVGVGVVGLPLSALIVFGTAWLAKKGGMVRNLSLLTVAALSSFLAFEMWIAVPTARHLQDVDHIPEGVPEFVPQLNKIEVDHVYYYNAQTLFCNIYCRYHIVRKADFDRLRDEIRREAAYRKTSQGSGERDDKTLIDYLGARSGEYAAIRSWWDWPGRPDCEVLCLPFNDLAVFDSARGVVYLVKSGD